MSIRKLLSFLVLASLIVSCGGGKKPIKPIIAFTPKLQREISDLKVIIPAKMETNNWPGINFVNELNSNFAIDQLSFKFKNSNMKLTGQMIAAPVINDNKLFILDSKNNVTCHDLLTQKQLWQTDLKLAKNPGASFAGGITLDGDKLYVVNNSMDLVILEASTGYEISRLSFSDIVLSPVALDDKNLYVLTANNQLVAFDKNTLSGLWKISGLQSTLNLLVQSFTQPIVLENSILTEFYSGQFSAIANIGKPIWQVALNSQIEDCADMSPANLSTQSIIDGKAVFIASSAGFLSKINVTDGTVMWQKSIQDVLSMNKFGNLLVLTTNAQEIVALSTGTGEISWVINLTETMKGYNKPFNLLTPFMINDVLYILSSNGKLYEISLDGNLLKTLDIPKNAKFYAVNKDTIYLFSKKNILHNLIKNRI
jgi:outer membrane protein assembly factor BamB